MNDAPLSNFGLIVSSVLGVFLIMGIGAFCRTRHWLTREADMSLAKITANVLLPALFLDRIITDETLGNLATAWTAPALGFAFTAGGFIAAWYTAKWIGPWMGLVNDAQHRAFAVCAGICNYGYIPLPLAQIFYKQAEVDLIFHNVGVDLALWSVGIAIVSGGSDRARQPSDPGRKPRSTIRKLVAQFLPALTSAPLIAVAVALTIRGLGWETAIPDSVSRSIEMLAYSSIPMGLLLSGAIIIDFIKSADWTGASRVIALSIGFRQGVMPLIMLGAAGSMLTQTDLKQVLLLQAAMPSAVFPIVLVRLYHGDTATALRVVLSTSIAGIVLIPLWMAVGAWWLQV
ncbi:AEC family transporter [Neorhodopirellula pilleata]|uniref:Membrane transport protein n=1 Tax=Neorhodopirellula pilleata TaxID=2714738 RepID=A0A5C6A2S6_9BACT|nr:AEC family transporter [Neorhodopirellula pilleata]TWT93660.1 Membrane transport protein [Neorhodopirellula pilleata]